MTASRKSRALGFEACQSLTSLGRSSVRTVEEIRKEDGTVSAKVVAVVVARDPETGRARPLTDAEREALEAELAA